LSQHSLKLLAKYEELYYQDPSSEETIEAGKELIADILESKRKKWCKVLGETDMKLSSRKAWKLIKNLSNDPNSSQSQLSDVTANQVAHQLLMNGKFKR